MMDVEKDLDRALAGKSHGADVEALVETAEGLRSAFTVPVPEARNEALFFATGVGLRKRSPLLVRLLVPVVAVAAAVVALVLIGRGAVPGDSFYPVRGALTKVGLASAPIREIDRDIRLARNLVIRAETALDGDPDRAEALAHEAIHHLGDAWEIVDDLDRNQGARRATSLRSLAQRASAVIAQAEAAQDRLERRRGSGDNSGPGSGADRDEDNSGPGSTGSDSDEDAAGSDSSGSGSRDDDGDERDGDRDSSGSGSDEDDETDSDSSGSGSGEDDETDSDSSGSGSGSGED